MGEFELTVIQKGEIKFDAEEAKKRIEERVSGFEKMVITESTIKDGKEIKATLNKERTAFDNERKAVKKDYEQPLKDFEAKVKDVLSAYDRAIENIDKQLKAFEEERIRKKQEHLHELYDKNIDNLGEFLPFDSLKKPQWDNATYSDNDILNDISTAKVKVMSDLEILKGLGSEILEQVIETYKLSCNDLGSAIKKNTDYQAAKQLAEQRVKEEAERKAKEEAERKAAEAAAEEAKAEEVIASEEIIDDLPFSDDDFASDDLPFAVDDPVVQIDLYSMDDVVKVTKFLDSNKIRYSYGTVTKI